jgi:hypothetical protein
VSAAPASGSRIRVCEAFLADILAPYRANARYLASAEITHVSNLASRQAVQPRSPLMRGMGTFAIPQSCDIDDAGHFNAVEFTICYNQLAYVLFGKCIATGLLEDLRFLTFAEYKRQQLPSWLIVSIESHYLKPLNRERLYGELTLNRVVAVRRGLFFFTTITFADEEDVKATGSVVLAFKPA